MSIEHDLDVCVVFDTSFNKDSIIEKELILIQSILPKLLEEIIVQTEIDKE